jgi:uncharacterized protein (DUF2062 family)
MILIAAFQFTHIFENAIGRWVVGVVAACAFVCLVLTEVFTRLAEKRREQRQEERDTNLIAKVQSLADKQAIAAGLAFCTFAFYTPQLKSFRDRILEIRC